MMLMISINTEVSLLINLMIEYSAPPCHCHKSFSVNGKKWPLEGQRIHNNNNNNNPISIAP